MDWRIRFHVNTLINFCQVSMPACIFTEKVKLVLQQIYCGIYDSWKLGRVNIFNEHWTVKILLIYDGDIIMLLHGLLHYNARQFITLFKHSWEQKLVVNGLNSRNQLTPLPILCKPSVQFDYSHPPWTIRTMIPQYLMSEHFVNQFASIFSFHRWSLPQRTSTRP